MIDQQKKYTRFSAPLFESEGEKLSIFNRSAIRSGIEIRFNYVNSIY